MTNYLTDRVREEYIRDQRYKLFKMTLKSDWSYLSKQKLGYLEKVLINDISFGASMLTHFTSASILLVNLSIYMLIALNISYQITFLTIILGLMVFIVFRPFIYKTRVLAYQSSAVMKEAAHHINENMVGAKTVKTMTLEETVSRKGREFFERLKNVQLKLSLYSNFTYAATQPISVLVILTLFYFSYQSQNFNFAAFAVIVYAINRIFGFVQSGQSRLHEISGLYPFLKSALYYEDMARTHREIDRGEFPFSFQNRICFNKVSFRYKDGEPILDDISFEVKRGEMLGIVGPSGSGKTTIVDLFLRLIAPKTGRILVDDTDAEKIKLPEWKKHIGYVAQDIFLTSDTIANNIRFYDPTITDADIVEAAKMANIYDFIISKPEGFETHVGERGGELSGGQKQRIALARALARKPEILVLDEATSALDNESEKIIREALDNLRGKITIVVIAHRPSTIANVDKLVVLDKGRIIEQDSPKKLLENRNSYYYKVLGIGSENE